MIDLSLNEVDVAAGGTVLVKQASLTLHQNELVALVGPNGAGKSTLLKSALGIVKASAGTITVGGEDINTLTPISRAQRIAYLPQNRPLAWPNRVLDLVALGRFAYGGNLDRLSSVDADAVHEAIEQCGIAHLITRKANTLSGGELALVHCARAFAARAPLLIADEPVAALDPQHQYRILKIIREHVDSGLGALIVLHDLSLAARFADRIVWMKDGCIQADGSALNTLTAERLADVFGISAKVDGSRVFIDGAL